MNNRMLMMVGVICVCLLLPWPIPAWAEEGGAAGSSYGTPLGEASVQGRYGASQQYFRIEDYWKVEKVDIVLDYKASPLTQSELSSMTLLLNGTPFHSFRPAAGNGDKQQVRTAAPVPLLTAGVNTLTIQSNLETSDPKLNLQLACLPTDSRDSWFQVLGSSEVTVSYSQEAMKNSIRDFNRHFTGIDTVSKGQNAVAVPASAEAEELEAAVYALSGFAKRNELKERMIPLVEYGADQLKDKRAVVLVSLFDRLPAELKAQLETDALQEKALLQLVNMNAQPTLVVTSRNAELLIQAGRLAANQMLLDQIEAGSKVVDAATAVQTPAVSISRNISLTETGDKLTGPQHREKSYFISLPGNRSIADASKLSLDFRYAKNLDMSRSMVTVYADKTPIGSKRLSSELADGDHLTLPVPKNLQISGNFTITVAFELELDGYTGCMENQDQMPWAFIDKQSLLQLNTKDRAELLLNNYPYPFLRDGSYNQVAVVLPDKRDPYLYASLTNLFNLLGQYAQTNTGEVRFFPGNVSAAELKGRQIIAIGGYMDNQVIRDSNDKLYFRYDTAGGGFVSNEKLSIEAEYGKRIGALQLIESPYDPGNGLLAVTGAGPQYAYLASKLVAAEAMLWKVYGDGVVADADGKVQAFRFKKLAEPEAPSVVGEVLGRKDVLSFTVASLLVALLVLVSLIMMLRKHTTKKSSRGRRRGR
ncbi:cellulose synthase subunit [Paenibacillus sp. UNCCL117]|uniref:cellulose biosynthesis cyclic di-GMP-binding regulatory protein BcsB n=1 Tax=unclassified Paenibacillus TaxID=185978 RepID=UPI00088FB6BA|nr:MULTISPECIES: cellulose biosynthesis cyclic di-GMP-binding regulatory protein BcsB [unclassified Paenibacillus]SDC17515.1 cellulose synthase subunit [Paenibacillus sp. cl123]SFW18024.1 cellulose synthase subunit [Paenibacillus sp. UNCCL117]